MAADLVHLDATELARRIRAKELSPVEVVRALRERAGAVNPGLNAIVTPIEDAEERARAAEAAVLRGEELGPLHGVPFTIKDSFNTAGTRTTRGSRFFADRVPAGDAAAVARLRAAGGIALAKTNLPEFALWWETDNLVFGRTVNPWDPERTAGGSSGGEAAAIAAGLSPLGLGSDLGGSIRLPAHYCGVAGLKPTHGRVPLTGHWPEVMLGFMHAGPLARSVRDVALALSLIAGPDGEDWHAVPVPPPGVPRGDEPLPPLRVGHPCIFPLRGEAAELDWAEGAYPKIEAHAEGLTLVIPRPHSRALPVARGLLASHLEALIRRDVSRWLAGYVPQLGLAPTSLRIRPMKSLWGSLDTRDRINLDLALALAPAPALRYVLVHELFERRRTEAAARTVETGPA